MKAPAVFETAGAFFIAGCVERSETHHLRLMGCTSPKAPTGCLAHPAALVFSRFDLKVIGIYFGLC
ncbi:MAG: hypothetical protein Q7U66_12625 [Methylobacter sp.]|nr:hypothetical protein [Methylobacter sp.]